MEGRIKEIARGVKFVAKPKLTKQEIPDLIKDFEAPGCSKTEIAGIVASADHQSISCMLRTVPKLSEK